MSRGLARNPPVNWVWAQGEDIVCDHCGGRTQLLPNPPEKLINIAGEFTKAHSKCSRQSAPPPFKSWSNPLDWVVGDDVSISARTIWAVAMGAKPAEHDPPEDPSDFGRCYRLLSSFPEWRARLVDVAAQYPAWRPFVAVWDEMTISYEEEVLADGNRRAPKLYNLLRRLRYAKAPAVSRKAPTATLV